MASFGVVPADISAMANGMDFTTTTRPPTAQVEFWITLANRRVSASIRAAGADPDTVALDSAGEGYGLAQDYVIHAVAARAVAARDRAESELSKARRSEASDILDEVRTWAAALGDQRNTNTDAPGLTWAPVLDATNQAPTQDAAFWANERGQL